MNNGEYRDCKKSNNAILFKIISKCNDSCSFCYAYDFMKREKKLLSIKEIKRNFLYYNKNFKIDYVILTGGEPTLHPDFFNILDFFIKEGVGFRFITNLIIFNDKDFIIKLKKRFNNFKTEKQRKLTKIIASINDEQSYSELSKKRFLGLKVALINDFPLMVTIVIYDRNLEKLVEVSHDLKKIFSFAPKIKKYHIEYRPIYLKGDDGKVIKRLELPKFKKLSSCVEKSLSLMKKENFIVTLWNYPLCYLKNFNIFRNDTVKDRMERKLILISKNKQMRRAGVRDWEIFLKNHQLCKKCREIDFCGGIDRAYIEKFSYPQVKAL